MVVKAWQPSWKGRYSYSSLFVLGPSLIARKLGVIHVAIGVKAIDNDFELEEVTLRAMSTKKLVDFIV